MRKTLFVASWKTYKNNITEVKDFFEKLPHHSATFKSDVVLCPSFVHLQTASENLPANIILGAQDVSRFASGAHTGETTAQQLAAFGVKYCIVGHVERRTNGETDEIINKKIHRLLEHGITPVICFGETLVEYDNDQTRAVIEKQMRDCLQNVRDMEKVVLCYMPIWSIGTGYYTSGEYSNIIADFMRKTAVKLTGNPMSANVQVIFGGQITQSNTKEYLETPEIDGVMFAVAAQTPEGLASIVNVEYKVKLIEKLENNDAPEPKKEKKGLFGKLMK